MRERRFVADSNVLVSRLLLPSGVSARALDKALANGRPLASEATLDELAEALSRAKFDRYASVEDRRHFMRLYARICEYVHCHRRVAACRDPKDDKFLELAVNGEADFILTGDRDLLELNPYLGTTILTPAQMLQGAELPEHAPRDMP